MDDFRTQLEDAVRDRYLVERELGSGGMAIVYLARDLKHDRTVAIKVFRPEVSAAIGSGRFLREIHTTAVLSHPNILPLFDSGQHGSLSYYVMPFVDGPTVANRILKERQLPLEDACDIARQGALALEHAHQKGIVHRDIKPGNLLLSGSHVFVADFGIAQALEDTGQRLTSTGIVVGTPTYMSPEQCMGEPVDNRSDIYSLGCVLYEMLVGEPPFQGRTAMAVLARHSVAEIPSIRAVRSAVPESIEEAVSKAMAKAPVDRFATSGEFAKSLAVENRPTVQVVRPRSKRRPGVWAAAAAAVALLAVLATLLMRPTSGDPPVLSPDIVAILPFRAAGSTDASLREVARTVSAGLVDRLPGEGALRAVFAGTVDESLRQAGLAGQESLSQEEAVEVARATGAGVVIMGEVGYVGDRYTIRATLRRVPSGDVVTQTPPLTTSPDSLLPTVDLLAAHLLAGQSGESPSRQALLVQQPLSRIREYLTGLRMIRRGEFSRANTLFSNMVEQDPTFVLPTLGAATTGYLLSDDQHFKGVSAALRHVTALDRGDRLYLEGLAGPRWPAPPSFPERINTWQVATETLPNDETRWFLLGEALFHAGPWTGAPDVMNRAADAFRHTIQLAPDFVPAMGHLIDLAASRGDTAEVRALAARYFTLDTAGTLNDFYRWRVGLSLNDTRLLEEVRSTLDSFPPAALERIVNVSQLDGLPLDDAIPATQGLWARSAQLGVWGAMKLQELALNRGRPAEAAGIARRLEANFPLTPRFFLYGVIDVLEWGADSSLVYQHLADRSAVADGIQPSVTDPSDEHYSVCGVSLWRLAHGDHAGAARGLAALARVRNPFSGSQAAYIGICTAILDASLAAADSRPDASAKLQYLDSLVRAAPAANTWILTTANLTASRLWEARGDLDRALAAVRRRVHITDSGEQRVLVAFSTLLAEEGRLAALSGDVASALTAYKTYLALRTDPEPSVAPEVARIRAEVARLEGAR